MVESRAQAEQARDLAGSGTTIVALSGEALQALDALDVAHVSVSELASGFVGVDWDKVALAELIRLSNEIEEFVLAREPRLRLEGPGFLSAQTYFAFYALIRAAKRSVLMIDAARALGATTLSAFSPGADPAAYPWLAVLAAASDGERFALELHDGAPSAPSRQGDGVDVGVTDRIALGLQRRLRELVARRGGRRAAEMRLLFLPGPRYSWTPVVHALGARDGLYWLDGGYADPARSWTYALGSVLRSVGRDERRVLAAPFERRPAEERKYCALFDEWLAARAEAPRIELRGVDLFPGIRDELREMVGVGPVLARHSDEVARNALAVAEPDAVCFFALPWLSGIRLAHAARVGGVPSVTYQHGGAYGTLRVLSHDVSDWRHVDHFLSLGSGIRLPRDPIVPLRSRITPVGSAVINARRGALPRLRRAPRRVLWVSEYATLDADHYHLDKETWRYEIERRCLEILGRSNRLDVTYRPFPSSELESGIVRWLAESSPAITVDQGGYYPHVVHQADVVVTNTASGTVVGEALGWGKSLVLIDDVPDDRLDAEYAAELEQACVWCRTTEAAVEAVELLAESPAEFAATLGAKDATRFVERYVLHVGNPVRNVIAFLNDLPRK